MAAPVGDLAPTVLAEALPGRAVRTYPAVLSTEADAMAWARAGAPHGAVVVADYQASPRGRAGRPWVVQQGRDLAFSVVLRPDLPPQRSGWLYVAATSAVADVVGPGAVVSWPDEVRRDGAPLGAVAVHADTDPAQVRWAVLGVHVAGATPPRSFLLAELVAAVEAYLGDAAEEVLEGYRSRCATLGELVRVRLLPLGPSAREVVGRAVDCRGDGGLVVETAGGRRVVVPPDAVGTVEAPGAEGGQ